MTFTNLKISDIPNIGIITIWPGDSSNIPIGWLACDGTEISRTIYSDLYLIIGNKYGSPENGLNFKLPNLNDSIVIGKTANNTIGQMIGSNTKQITSGMLPQHSHTISIGFLNANSAFNTGNSGNHNHGMDNGGGHSHTYKYNTDENGNSTDRMVLTGNGGNGNMGDNGNGVINNAGDHSHTIHQSGDHSHSGNVSISHGHNANASAWPSNGTQDNFNVIQSSIVMFYIIRAKNI